MSNDELIARFIPMAREMLSQSGGWDNCPFCGSTDGSGSDDDETAWHTPDCILRNFVKAGEK